MKKAYKCALIKEQIEGTKKLIEHNDNLVEIQLLSIKDDLSLINEFSGRVSSIHLPIEKEDRTCNLSTVLKAMEIKNKKFDFLYKIASYAVCENAGLVIHANVQLKDVLKSKGYEEFIYFLNKTKVKIYLENTFDIKNAKDSLLTPVIVSSELCKATKSDDIHPLLDVCHYQISLNQFDSNLKINMDEILEIYGYDDMRMHLCSALGDGGIDGVHGSNFKENIELLKRIIHKTKEYDPVWILETAENDYCNKPNAVWLNNKINEILEVQNEIK